MQPLRPIALALGLLIGGAAVPASQARPVEPRASAPLVLHSTAQLTADSKLAALLDQLARQPRLEGHAAGFPDLLGPAEALVVELAARASREQFLRFKDHKSPIVRGAVLRHVVRAWPESVDALYPLLMDPGRVLVRQGCLSLPVPIAALLLTELASRRDHPSVRALLGRATADTQLGWIQEKARALVSGTAP